MDEESGMRSASLRKGVEEEDMRLAASPLDAVARARRFLALYDRVHDEMDDGKTWDEIDCGFREPRSYSYWKGYMTTSLIHCLREIVWTHDASAEQREAISNPPIDLPVVRLSKEDEGK